MPSEHFEIFFDCEAKVAVLKKDAYLNQAQLDLLKDVNYQGAQPQSLPKWGFIFLCLKNRRMTVLQTLRNKRRRSFNALEKSCVHIKTRKHAEKWITILGEGQRNETRRGSREKTIGIFCP